MMATEGKEIGSAAAKVNAEDRSWLPIGDGVLTRLLTPSLRESDYSVFVPHALIIIVVVI